jgi:hypothetical protein
VLLAEGAARYHYVLVVGWSATTVRVHDPGRGPGLAMSIPTFLKRWESAGRWAFYVVGPSTHPGESAAADSPSDDLSTSALLEQASAAFRASRWEDAASTARAAARSEPGDARAWTLLATASYLAGDAGSALSAWNRVGEPRLDLIRVEGLERTRHPVVHELLGLRGGTVLTTDRLQRARRRLELLPSARVTTLAYRALPGGLAEVDATVVEPALQPSSLASGAALLVRALLGSEVEARVAGPSGGGEALSVALRWARARSRARAEVSAPALLGVPGVGRLGFLWERERHRSHPTGAATSVERSGVALTFADWANGWLGWEVGAGAQRLVGLGEAPLLSARIEASRASGRADLTARLERSLGRGELAYSSWSLLARAEAIPQPSPWSLTARVLLGGVDASAPRLLWPGAGVGRARQGLLRAHPLEQGGALAAETLWPRMANGTVELERNVLDVGLAGIALATFTDVARFAGPRAETSLRSFLDGGVGLRVHLGEGRVRFDAAASRDGSRALSLVWESRERR